jgi:subtilase family serine protease
MKNSGYVLLLDALIALVLFLVIVTSIFSIEHPKTARTEVTTFRELHFMSEDVLDVLNKEGSLDEIATSWAEGDFENASELSLYYFERMVPEGMGYMLTIDDQHICNSTWNGNRTLESESIATTHSTRLLVGYGRDLPVLGYIADASLSAISSIRKSSYAFFGGYVGDGNITRIITLPFDANITNVYMELNAVTTFNLFVNGDYCGIYNPSAGNMTADSWEPDESCFDPGENRIDINFTGNESNYIGGGYIRIDYETNETDTTEDSGVYWFPGIKGLINVYSSFYVPGELNSMGAYLHYKNNISNTTVYLVIGNTTISLGNATGEQKIPLTHDNFTSPEIGMDYTEFSGKTVPLKLFGDTGNYTTQVNITADIVLVTDTSGSMEFCAEGQSEGCCQMVPDTCSVGDCSYGDVTWNDSYVWETKELLVHGLRWTSTCPIGIEKKIDITKNASKLFVEIVLTNPESRIGLVEYSSPQNAETIPRPDLQVTRIEPTDHLSEPGVVGQNATVEICYGLINSGYNNNYVIHNSFITRFYLDNGTHRWEVTNTTLPCNCICGNPFPYDRICPGTETWQCDSNFWRTYPDLGRSCHAGGVPQILFKANYPPGNYSLIGVVDADDDHLECNESNNNLSVNLTIRSPMADLIITDLWVDHFEPTSGNYEFVVNATVKNQGEVNVITPFEVSFYHGDVGNNIGSAITNSLNVGETKSAVLTWNPTKAEVCSGPVNAIAWADYPLNQIPEVWENNNNRTQYGGLPDLTVTSFFISPTLDGPNKTIIVPSWAVKNIGYGTSGPFNVTVYLSNETDTWEVDKGRILPYFPWCCDANRGLRPNGEFKVNYNSGEYWCNCPCTSEYPCWVELHGGVRVVFSFKTPLTPGDYIVTIVVDSDNEVPECNELNNNRTVPLTVRPAQPDLTISNWGGFSSTEINYTATVRNQGEADSGPFDVSFYDDIVNPANLIDSVNVNNVEAYTGTRDVYTMYTPPDNICDHSTVTVWADHPDDDIEELVETNNDRAFKVPGIEITSLSFSPVTEAEIYNGSNTYINFRIKNTGDTLLHIFHVSFYYEDGTKIGTAEVKNNEKSYYNQQGTPSSPTNIPDDSGVAPDCTYRVNGGVCCISCSWIHYTHDFSYCGNVMAVKCGFVPFTFTAPTTPGEYNITAVIDEANEVIECKDDNNITVTLEVLERPPTATAPPAVPFDPSPYIILLFLFLAAAPFATRAVEIHADRPVMTSITLLSIIALTAVVISGDIPCEPAEKVTFFQESITGVVELTNDSTVLNEHIEGLETWNMTCICCGINRAREMLDTGTASTKVIVVMSDGVANVQCPEQDTGNAIMDAVLAADEACDDGILVYAVGFGADVDEGTLKEMACNESMYYNSTNAVELANVYRSIAEQIVGGTMVEQTISASENVSRENILYTDSHINLSFSPIASLREGEIAVILETAPFGNSLTNGSFHVPNGTRIIDAKVTSYSGPYWTDRLYVRNATDISFKKAYLLSDYSGTGDYGLFGDPYVVSIPADQLGAGLNFVNISAGRRLGFNYPVGGSPDDRAIYTIAVKAHVGYGTPKQGYGDGCNWTVQFYDGTTANVLVPSYYMGPKTCNYTPGTFDKSQYDNSSAIDDAVYRLFTALDIYSGKDANGELDVKFDPEDIAIESTITGGVRSLWGPARVKLILWQ